MKCFCIETPAICCSCVPGVHKSQAPAHCGGKTVYDCTSFLSVLSMELASCHPPGA